MQFQWDEAKCRANVRKHGLDFADALHMARSSRASGFATFDQRLAGRAKRLALAPPVELLV